MFIGFLTVGESALFLLVAQLQAPTCMVFVEKNHILICQEPGMKY